MVSYCRWNMLLPAALLVLILALLPLMGCRVESAPFGNPFDPDAAEVPDPVQGVTLVAYRDGVYRFQWHDPPQAALAGVEATLEPLGLSGFAPAGDQYVEIPAPSTEQLLLLTLVCVDVHDNRSEPVYLLFPGERSYATSQSTRADPPDDPHNNHVYFFDEEGLFAGFNQFEGHDTNVLDMYVYNTRSPLTGSLSTEHKFNGDGSLQEYALFEFDNVARTVTRSAHDPAGVLQNRLEAEIDREGYIHVGYIYDAAGNLIQTQNPTYDERGILTAYIFRDPDGTVLDSQIFISDTDGNLRARETYDGTGTLLRTREFFDG